MSDQITNIVKFGVKARGRNELILHLQNEKLKRGQAILAKCYDCMGFYADGKVDCQVHRCPLYGYMPYRDMT